MDIWIRRLRGLLGTAAVWGVGWAAFILAIFSVLMVFGFFPEGTTWLDGLITAARGGIVGGVVGAAFSTAIAVVYRGRKLSEISWLRFGIGGAVVTGLFLPFFLQVMNVLSGDGMVPWEYVLDDALWAALVGGGLAGGMLKAAQMSERALPDGDLEEVEGHADVEHLPAAGQTDTGRGPESEKPAPP